jgi:hypothetical protein
MMNRTNSVARIIRFLGAMKHLTQGYTRTWESKKEESEDQWSFRRGCDQHLEITCEHGWILSTAALTVPNTASANAVPAALLWRTDGRHLRTDGRHFWIHGVKVSAAILAAWLKSHPHLRGPRKSGQRPD